MILFVNHWFTLCRGQFICILKHTKQQKKKKPRQRFQHSEPVSYLVVLNDSRWHQMFYVVTQVQRIVLLTHSCLWRGTLRRWSFHCLIRYLRSLPTPGRFFFPKIEFFHILIFCSTSYYKKNSAK